MREEREAHVESEYVCEVREGHDAGKSEIIR
jgi:hypothetical protein